MQSKVSNKMNILSMILICHSIMGTFWSLAKIEYKFTHDLIDVVIPCHEKDLQTLELVIRGVRENITCGRIIVVSQTRLSENAEWFDEKMYPFSMEDISFEIFRDKEKALGYIANPCNRIGWIYQQFLKLYAVFVIPNISKNILILDADTIFLHPVIFQAQDGIPLFNVGEEFTPAYFEIMARLIPGLNKVFWAYSGICHHMLFQRPVLEDLFEMIESVHKKPVWRAICHAIDLKDLAYSCFSEYELYFNFIFSRSDQPLIRKLQWLNCSFKLFNTINKNEYDYVSCHSWS